MGIYTITDPVTGGPAQFQISGDTPSPTEQQRIDQYFEGIYGRPEPAAPAVP